MRRARSITIASYTDLGGHDPSSGLEGSFVLLDRTQLPDEELGNVIALSATACVVRAVRKSPGSSRYTLWPDRRGSVKSTLYVAEGADGVFRRAEPKQLYTVSLGVGNLAIEQEHRANGELSSQTAALLGSSPRDGSLVLGAGQIDDVLGELAKNAYPLATHAKELMDDAMTALRIAHTQ